jgi:hypothetical protein
MPPCALPPAPACGRLRRKESAMLELRPNCECCDKDLPPGSAEARICTYECTFCADCTETKLEGVCPNCGGNLVARPIRPPGKLFKDPASTRRILKPEGCAA